MPKSSPEARSDSNVVQTAIDRVEAVGDVRKQNRQLVPEQGDKNVRQHFVGPVANKDLLPRNAKLGVASRDRPLQEVSIRVRVEAQRLPTVGQFCGNCSLYLR
jgi:hypothetical protein